MLCSGAQNFHLLCSILCSCEKLVLKFDCFIRVYSLVSLNFLSQLFYLKFNTLAVVQNSNGECSIKVYNHIFSQTVPIMLALCLMLLATYYAQNYADIIGWSLIEIIQKYFP